jgi:N-acetylglucosaminyldiphosphoundecaprenol N-acetyl-beta-D-mannosaminyltransferase
MGKMTVVSGRRGYRQFHDSGGVGVAEKLKETLVGCVPEAGASFAPTTVWHRHQ